MAARALRTGCQTLSARLPSVAVPVGTERRSGLPLSVQLVGRTGQEERLLRYAAALMALLAPMGRPPGC